jgi:DNA gyrase subunit B
VLTYADGTIYQGSDLAVEAAWLREAWVNLRRLASDGPTTLLEQAAIVGALTADYANTAQERADLAARLAAISLPAERGWVVDGDERGLTMRRMVRGVADWHTIEAGALRSAEARWLFDRRAALFAKFEKPATLKLDRETVTVNGPASAFDRILAQGRKGLTINRFKGLGEMNPEQLWKTTLDPAVRILLQVRVGDVEDASEVFSTLMGDVVEPRRDFIVGNALKVANLDV